MHSTSPEVAPRKALPRQIFRRGETIRPKAQVDPWAAANWLRKLSFSWGARLGAPVFWLVVRQIAAVVINQGYCFNFTHSDHSDAFSLAQLRGVLGFYWSFSLRIFAGGALYFFTAGSLLAFLSFKYKLIKILFEPIFLTIKSPWGIVCHLLLIWVARLTFQFHFHFWWHFLSSTLQYLRGSSALTSSLLRWLMYTTTVGNALKVFYLSQPCPA